MYLLLTGGTGLLGEYLLRDLALRGIRIAVIARGTKGATAAARVDALCERWDKQANRHSRGLQGYRPVVLAGDITVPGLGLSAEDRRWVARHCEQVLHNAASLTFDADRSDGEPWRSNLGGTENTVSLVRELGLRRFHHVSTAYVCGTRTGRVTERELDQGQSFCNEYEASKCAAELLVRSAGFSECTVYRPAIIVGDSITGYTSTYHGFYAPLKSMAALLTGMQRNLNKNGASNSVAYIPRTAMMAALGLAGNERKHFVPVQWVSEAMVSLFMMREAWGGTYHLTSNQPVTSELAAQAMERAFAAAEKASQPTSNTPPARVSGDWSQIGEMFSQQLNSYRTYWRDDPEFDASDRESLLPHLPSPELDLPTLQKLCQYALSHNFGWPKHHPPQIPHAFGPWLEARGLLSGDDAPSVLQIQALGQGGGEYLVRWNERPGSGILDSSGQNSMGQISLEAGFDPDLPRLTFHALDLADSGGLHELIEDGRAVLRWPQAGREMQVSESHIEDRMKRWVSAIDRHSDVRVSAKHV